ncbi:methyltransferase domain-containing protein [Colletotrichum limetticola]|uniref:Methyltransferase domain-containing protein n=1 Tax=Colletotrichum limetticola TaxID=1209924 RepID=A0ABQ9P771_9PEZI|nr:methyltransferase domain-containing protein [Colletotrichum limetticola]
MTHAELSPERMPYYLSEDNTDPSLNVAYLKDAHDLLHHTLKNEPRAKVDLNSLPYSCTILDYGMRTGIWSIEMAELVTSPPIIRVAKLTKCKGADKLPENLTIAIGDDERVWRKGSPYDIIHARVVESIVDWQDFPKIAYDCLNPGGRLIVEMVDLMPCGDEQRSFPADSALKAWAEKFRQYDKRQADQQEIEALLRDQGFDVTCVTVDLPINPYRQSENERESGKSFHWCLRQFLQAKCFASRREAPPQEMLDLVAEATKEIRNPDHHAFCKCYILTASKRVDNCKPWW